MCAVAQSVRGTSVTITRRIQVPAEEQRVEQVDYAVCERAWAKKGTRTLRDVLVWYNNMDGVPFLGGPKKDEPVLAPVRYRHAERSHQSAWSGLQIRNITLKGPGLTPLQFPHGPSVPALQK